MPPKMYFAVVIGILGALVIGTGSVIGGTILLLLAFYLGMKGHVRMAVANDLPKIYPAVIAATIFSVFSASPGAYFILFPGTLCVFIWGIVAGVFAWKYPPIRKIQAARVGVWVIAITAAFVVHHVRDSALREQADALVTKIQTYTATNGHCPATLEDIGQSTKEIRKTLRGSYGCHENTMRLFYRSSTTLFDIWSYDFEKNEWVFVPD
ncbi:MAG: hypothetical protein LBU53_06200 [Zoogloeaceae bacterium]|jgi:hypothetical protein|nr:hypothetical protein [Zoogloeaceae bacterium]